MNALTPGAPPRARTPAGGIPGIRGGRVGRRVAGLAVLLLAPLSSCADLWATPPPASSAPAPAGVAWPPPRTSWALPAPAGPDGPSVSALQVCSPDDGQKAIAGALGVTPTRVEQPTWRDHLYRCRYDYPRGSFVLSVKELADDAETGAYTERLAAELGKLAPLDGIGEAAFYTRNGSIVVRKDFKVMLVDITGLPARFGDPPAPPAAVSRIIATVIMGCWSGA